LKKKLPIPLEGNEKIDKEIVLKFEKNWPCHQRVMKKMKYAHENLK
jgi:hypothetical protein